jgi:hypothetical protein
VLTPRKACVVLIPPETYRALLDVRCSIYILAVSTYSICCQLLMEQADSGGSCQWNMLSAICEAIMQFASAAGSAAEATERCLCSGGLRIPSISRATLCIPMSVCSLQSTKSQRRTVSCLRCHVWCYIIELIASLLEAVCNCLALVKPCKQYQSCFHMLGSYASYASCRALIACKITIATR